MKAKLRISKFVLAVCMMTASYGSRAVDALTVDSSGNIGVGTTSPSEVFHVTSPGTSFPVLFLAEATSFESALFRFRTTSSIQDLDFNKIGDNFRLNFVDGDTWELQLDPGGNLTIKGTLSSGSSKTYKHNIDLVDNERILQKVVNLPINEWSYKTKSTRHIGPMAEDFADAFGLGNNEKQLSPMDVSGVAIASIQAINAKLQAKDEKINALEQQLMDIRDKIEAQNIALKANQLNMEKLLKVILTQSNESLITTPVRFQP